MDYMVTHIADWAKVARDAEVTKLRTQWNSLTVGKPKALHARRRVQFRL